MTGIGKDQGHSAGQIVGAAQNRTVVEDNDGLQVFANRLGLGVGLGRQTPQGDGHFQANGIRSQRCVGFVLAIRLRRSFGCRRHVIPALNDPTSREIAHTSDGSNIFGLGSRRRDSTGVLRNVKNTAYWYRSEQVRIRASANLAADRNVAEAEDHSATRGVAAEAHFWAEA